MFVPVAGCPLSAGMIGICVQLCSNDGDCRAGEKCCFNGCGHTCTRPGKKLVYLTNRREFSVVQKKNLNDHRNDVKKCLKLK